MAKAKTVTGAQKKSGASKKGGSKRRLVVPGDPPIIVGGGGSAYIWVRLDQDERPVNPSSNNANTGIKTRRPTSSDQRRLQLLESSADAS